MRYMRIRTPDPDQILLGGCGFSSSCYKLKTLSLLHCWKYCSVAPKVILLMDNNLLMLGLFLWGLAQYYHSFNSHLIFCLRQNLTSLTKYPLCPNFAIFISVNFAVFILNPLLNHKATNIIATSIIHHKLDYFNSLYYNLAVDPKLN